jgi:hypothetical protein
MRYEKTNPLPVLKNGKKYGNIRQRSVGQRKQNHELDNTKTRTKPMLTPEEDYLWESARTWRRADVPTPPNGLDWNRVVKVGKANRMQTLLHTLLTRRNQLDSLPDKARTFLQTDVDKIANHATLLSDYLRPYLRSAAEQGMETVVLKGLAVSINIYGNAAMRPGGDIDILVRRNEVERSLAIQEKLGVGPYWDNLMDDRYYERHHLHQQRCTPDLVVWFETHWALDHPLTRLTVDYDGILDRTTPGELLGEPVNDLSPPDLILCLALHLVKHALYLPSVISHPDLARIILADGMVMYFVDIAEAIKQYGEQMEWNLVVQLATEWGAVDTMGSVLRVCASLLDTPVPAWVLDALPVRGPGGITRRARSGDPHGGATQPFLGFNVDHQRRVHPTPDSFIGNRRLFFSGS